MPPNRLLMRRCLQSETGFHFASQDANSSGEVRILPNGKLDFPKILRTRKGGSTIIEISQSSSSTIPIFFDRLTRILHTDLERASQQSRDYTHVDSQRLSVVVGNLRDKKLKGGKIAATRVRTSCITRHQYEDFLSIVPVCSL